MEGMIDITGADLKEVVKAAYDLSVPQGLGFLHYQEGGLTDEEVNNIVAEAITDPTRSGQCILRLDYVKGRACKMNVFADNGKLFVRNSWYDHNSSKLNEFLERIGIDV